MASSSDERDSLSGNDETAARRDPNDPFHDRRRLKRRLHLSRTRQAKGMAGRMRPIRQTTKALVLESMRGVAPIVRSLARDDIRAAFRKCKEAGDSESERILREYKAKAESLTAEDIESVVVAVRNSFLDRISTSDKMKQSYRGLGVAVSRLKEKLDHAKKRRAALQEVLGAQKRIARKLRKRHELLSAEMDLDFRGDDVDDEFEMGGDYEENAKAVPAGFR